MSKSILSGMSIGIRALVLVISILVIKGDKMDKWKDDKVMIAWYTPINPSYLDGTYRHTNNYTATIVKDRYGKTMKYGDVARLTSIDLSSGSSGARIMRIQLKNIGGVKCGRPSMK